MKARKHLFLLYFVLTLTLALVLRYFVYPIDNEAGKQSAQRIAREVQKELQKMNVSVQKIRTKIEQQPAWSFGSLLSLSKHPYQVYRNGTLIFWSDYRFVPSYELISDAYQVRLLTLKTGKFLTRRETFKKGNDLFEVYAFLPVYRKYKVDNDYLQSGYNKDIFPNNNLQITLEPSPSNYSVFTEQQQFLFAVEFFGITQSYNQHALALSVVLGLISVVLLGMYIKQRIIALAKKGRYELGFFLLAFYLFLIRAVMLYYTLPFSLVELDLFNSKYYASSETSPSLGDLLLNVLAVGILSIYLLRHYYKTKTYRWVLALPLAWRKVASLLIVLLSYWTLYLHFYVLRTIYLHSQLTLDITQSIDFTIFKIVCLLIFIINSCVYFMAMHMLCSTFIRLNVDRLRGGWLFVLGTAAYMGLFLFLDIYYHIILVMNALYFLSLYYFRLPRFLYKFRYATSIYLFSGALVCAGIGAYAIYNLELIKDMERKERFGAQLLAENDVLGEFLIDEAAQTIKKDAFIENSLTGPFGSHDLVIQKIKRFYLNRYFDKYDIDIFIFNEKGKLIHDPADTRTEEYPHALLQINDPIDSNYALYQKRYQHPRYATSYPHLYFVNEFNRSIIKQYVCFIPLQRHESVTGHIVIDMKLKKVIPRDVYPELLVDKRFLQSPESRKYSYAIYSGRRLVYSAGNYNYAMKMPYSLLRSPILFSEGVERSNYLHKGVKGANGKVTVVSSEVYPLSSIFSNFSFLFLLLIVFTVNFIITYALQYRFERVNTNFATKIQLYLNLAFFLPLFIVSIATLSIVGSAYKDNLADTFMKKAESISTNILNQLDSYEDGKIAKSDLSRELLEIAQYSESDVNIFDAEGRLSLASQPLIYESGLLSRYINPKAYQYIVETKEKKVLIPEEVGNLHYNSAYVGVKSRRGELLGIVSIPFFESKTELDKQIIGVISTIMNTFTTIFIFFLVLSYFASQILTVPLRLITQKIRKTTLNDYNEPLEWDSDDEIGLLVGEYNRMLLKLEASKAALSQSEKESAWREMAKQVAHEIKNPLTPMKLVLQHLQRTLQRDNAEIAKRTERPFETLLEQVDTLSDIATSFSDFAKMPIPKNEVFEITSVLKTTTDLYANDEKVNLAVAIPDEEVYVIGDRQLMGRIFTNLILNGIQSVPPDRRPHIALLMHQNGHAFVKIEVKDNGAGISEKIQHKVFIPNFSTKYAGSGIGLALAKRGVEHAGGKIWFETEEGTGTSFFVELPLAKPIASFAQADAHSDR